MYEDNTIGVVVPAYNEEGFVGDVVETLPSFVDRAYVVDDCSTDGTWEEIQRVRDRSQSAALADGGDGDMTVVAIQHEENRGVGGAVKTGYLQAREDGMDVVTVMGGDGQMDPDELEVVVEPVASGRADYAKGNRFLREETLDEMPRFRYAGSLLLTYLTRIASGYWEIGDSQTGYTAISREALEAIDVEEMFEFYGYCNDILVRLSAADRTVVDVPISAVYGDEESDIELTTYVPKVSFMLLRMFVWRLAVKRDTPAENLRTGLFAAGGAATVGGLLWTVATRNGTRGLVVVLGALSLLAGMATDAVVNGDRNGPERP